MAELEEKNETDQVTICKEEKSELKEVQEEKHVTDKDQSATNNESPHASENGDSKVNECEINEKEPNERCESKLEADMEVNSSIAQAKSPSSQDEKTQKNEDDQNAQKDSSLANTVAKHYNNIPAGSKEVRKNSRIFYLRNFNNWCKSVLITEFLEKVKRHKRLSDEVNVLDLGCGKGGDLLKWEKARVDHVIFADIAATSIEHCKERYKKLENEYKGRKYSRNHLFTSEYHAADCTKEQLREKYQKKDIKLDLTSCQFAFHYSFESYEQADLMLKNACENLRVGGYFIGTTLNANKVVSKLKASEKKEFGNSVYNIKYESDDNFPIFGAQYMFHLEDVVDCPEFLVHMPTLEKLAAKYDMVLKWKKSFHALFEEYKRDYDSLLNRMNALEKYPSSKEKPLCGPEDQYEKAKDYKSKHASAKSVGTLSADEWEMTGLYLAFAFEKVDARRDRRSSDRDDRKRRRDKSSDSRSSGRGDKSHHRDSKHRGSGASSAKRSRKESEVEEVYEIKDEVEGDDEIETSQENASEKTQDLPAADSLNDPTKDAASVTSDQTGDAASVSKDSTSDAICEKDTELKETKQDDSAQSSEDKVLSESNEDVSKTME